MPAGARARGRRHGFPLSVPSIPCLVPPLMPPPTLPAGCYGFGAAAALAGPWWGEPGVGSPAAALVAPVRSAMEACPPDVNIPVSLPLLQSAVDPLSYMVSWRPVCLCCRAQAGVAEWPLVSSGLPPRRPPFSRRRRHRCRHPATLCAATLPPTSSSRSPSTRSAGSSFSPR